MEEDGVIFVLKLTRLSGYPNLRGFGWFGDRTSVFLKLLDSSSTCDCSDFYFVTEHGGVPFQILTGTQGILIFYLFFLFTLWKMYTSIRPWQFPSALFPIRLWLIIPPYGTLFSLRYCHKIIHNHTIILFNGQLLVS